ncbi:MAG: hypothetical protein MZV63_55365 [Marinilabiliales bacterium]|nr:hypothetical protein [Marinilabiliales bacterium]
MKDPIKKQYGQAAPFGYYTTGIYDGRTRPRKVSGWWGLVPDMPAWRQSRGKGLERSDRPFRIPRRRSPADDREDRGGGETSHPMIDGIWAKESPRYVRFYTHLIADYDENTIDELLQYTKRAGLMSLYHMYPWVSWGHTGRPGSLSPAGRKASGNARPGHGPWGSVWAPTRFRISSTRTILM